MIEDPCPTCGGSGLTLQRKRYRVNIPAGVQDGSRIRLAGKGEDGPRGGPPGDLYVVTRVAPSPVFRQRADGNLEVDGPDHDRRGDPGRDDRGADAERHEADPGPARDPARHGPAAARRGAAEAGRRRPRRHPLPARDRDARGPDREQRGRSSEFAEAINGHDPRERLLRDASAASAKVGDVSDGAREAQAVATSARRRGRRSTDRRGVFMISVAAELAEMHPQTLRMYEARGLITPKRSPKNTRLYSHEDVERLRRIQQMTAEEGLNLAGVETVLELERELERARAEIARMRERAAELERQMSEELERVRRSLRAEIVPYGAYEAPELGPGSRRPAVGLDPDRAPTRRRRAQRLEQPLGDPATVSIAVVVRGLVVGEDGDRELAVAVALAQLGRLMDEGVVGQPAALEPHRPASPAAAGMPQLWSRRSSPAGPWRTRGAGARTRGRGRRRSAPCRRR